MKQILYILTLMILFSCGNNNHNENKSDNDSFEVIRQEEDKAKREAVKQDTSEYETENNTIDFQKQTLKTEFKNATLYKLTDTITADFNGDGKMDKAFFIKENQTSGIVIKQGSTDNVIRIGFEQRFAHLTNFNWIDFWGLVTDSATYEIIFSETDIVGDTIIGLENPSIVVRKDEVGGGLITFKNGEYKWIHQSD